jgi:hypothetical protein
MSKKSIPYESVLIEDLKNKPEEATAYLEVHLNTYDDDRLELLRDAFTHIAEAYGFDVTEGTIVELPYMMPYALLEACRRAADDLCIPTVIQREQQQAV